MLEILSGYLLGITIVTFFAFGGDKVFARWRFRRISERMLLGLMAAGGCVGGLFGMHVFRHKTQKSSFFMKAYIITLVWLGILCSMYVYTG